jgi:hypothetical protein
VKLLFFFGIGLVLPKRDVDLLTGVPCFEFLSVFSGFKLLPNLLTFTNRLVAFFIFDVVVDTPPA